MDIQRVEIRCALFVLLLTLWGCGGGSSQPPATGSRSPGADSTPATTPTGAPAPTWSFDTGLQLPLAALADGYGRPFLYVAQKAGGLVVYDISAPQSPVIAAVVERDRFNSLDVVQIAFATTPSTDERLLYVALGDLFAARGSAAGLAIVEVTDPRVPVVRAVWTSTDISAAIGHGSSHIVVQGEHAYLAAMREGVHVFNVANSNVIAHLATVLPDVDFPQTNPSSIAFPNARGLALDGDTLFIANDAGGLRTVDVSDPTQPFEVGRFRNAAMANKQAAYNHVVIDKGLEKDLAYVAVDYCGIEVIDISDVTRPRLHAWWNPWRCETNSNTWLNSAGHTNQLVLDSQRRQLLMSAGDSELLILDLADSAQPKLLHAFGATNDGLGAWGIAVGTNEVFVTYIRALLPFRGQWAGIKAFRR